MNTDERPRAIDNPTGSQRRSKRTPGFMLFVAVALFLSTYLLLFGELHFAPYPDIDTQFTSGFSWQKYEQVHNGMRQDQVRALLGEPFPGQITEGFPTTISDDCWRYSRDGKFILGDFSWTAVTICFNDRGTVTEKHRDVRAD